MLVEHMKTRGRWDCLALVLCAGAVSCFDSSFAAGHPCQRDQDCGSALQCIDGYCGGERPQGGSTTTEGDSSSTAAITDTETAATMPAGATTGATTEATSEGTTTGSPYLCDKIDILFIFDTSRSMNQWDNALFTLSINFLNVVSPVLENVGSYHIGAIPVSQINEVDPPDCEVPGGLWIDVEQGPFCAQYEEKPYLDENDVLDVLSLGCLFRVDSGSDDEQPMHSMLEAVSGDMNGPGGCNEGFIRSDALLVVVLMTDEDDDHDDEQGNQGSPGDPQFWYEKLLFYKHGNEDAIVFGALLGEDPADSKCPWMLPDDKDESTASTVLSIGAEEGVRIRQFMDRLPVGHAYVSSICDDSYVNFFQQFFEEIVTDACEDFDPLAIDPTVSDPTDG